MKILYITILFIPLLISAQNCDEIIKNLEVPQTIESFNPLFHFPPVNQDTTSACWSFSTLSFFETEMQRIGRKPVKLAMMYPVYQACLQKTERFIETKGMSRFAAGDLFSTVIDIIREKGIVPMEVYPGQTRICATFNHDSLYFELNSYLKKIKQDSLWDKEIVTRQVREILDKHLGVAPENFSIENINYTPVSFAKDYIGLQLDSYIMLTSFLYAPFDTLIELKVPDNWKHTSGYYNLPLEEFYKSLKKCIESGFSVVIDADMTEPGRCGKYNICVIPEFDIPGTHITQLAREYRFNKNITTDDHLMHVIGYQNYQGKDWFLVKDSWRDAWEGRHKGYFFFSGDFVRLKVLAFLVHRDALPDIADRTD